MMDRGLYLYVMKQLAEDLPTGLDEETEESWWTFKQRFEDFIKIGYELLSDECEVEIWSTMDAIRANLDDDQWAQLTSVLSDKGEIQLIRISLFGKPLLETGRFFNAPDENALLFGNLPRPVLKGVTKGILQVIREQELNVVEAFKGRAGGKVDVSDDFASLFNEVLDDEIEETVSEFRQSLMAEVTAAQFTPWGPPTGNPVQKGGES